MTMTCGIVGLPNVGKSTLFNALTKTCEAMAANYPFCTIEPNTGVVDVPDARMQILASIAGSQKLIHAKLSFIDIAGLVKGASKGDGLGNKFLGNIREVDAIVHVLRCFDDKDIIHVENAVNPIADAEVVNTELMLADLESLEGRKIGLEKKAKTGDAIAKQQLSLLPGIIKALEDGKPARSVEIPEELKKAARMLGLLTIKPVLYVANVGENEASTGNAYAEKVQVYAKKEQAGMVIISAKIEQDIANLPLQEQQEFLESLELKETGLDKIIQASYHLLNLETFFTVGPKECHAWTIKNGTKAPMAAGEIHTDFEKGFICAETIGYSDYVALKGEQGAKDGGKLRLEGKEYSVQDGDVMNFRVNT